MLVEAYEPKSMLVVPQHPIPATRPGCWDGA
jgi:hypothetical protein